MTLLSKKSIVIVCLLLAIVFHFLFYFGLYGPASTILNRNAIFALGSATLGIVMCIGFNWRSNFKDTFISSIFILLIIWIIINYGRSLLEIHNPRELKELALSPYTGLSLFPVLFFTVGLDYKNFGIICKLFTAYLFLAWLFSMLYINRPELGIFLLMPIFFIIITIPWQSLPKKLFILLMAISVMVISLTNRAGIIRILISLLIVVSYYLLLTSKVNRKLVNVLVFLILILPFYFLYLGINGNSFFQLIAGSNFQPNGLEVSDFDTRTFLYYEVFQDLSVNKAFILGKGINAGYYSNVFMTFNRTIVEVGFLQILLKTGIIGFILYSTMIFSAIYKALLKSDNLFIKSLGILLASYFILLFVENVVAFNLLNVLIWIAIGMCHSHELRSKNDSEIRRIIYYR